MFDLDTLLDPWALMQARQAAGEAGYGLPRRRFDPLTPEEEAAKLPTIAGSARGGIGYVGASLAKPGRVIRCALAGRPRELLNVVPFSDALGWTDPAEETTGRDLLRQWGAVGDENNWGNFLGGLAVDMATDPLMYATFGSGAATQAGKVAQKIGALPAGQSARMGGSLRQILAASPELQAAAETAAGGTRQLAGMIDRPLAGLFGWHVPFSGAFTPGGIGGAFLEGQRGLDVLAGAGKVARAVGGPLAAASRTINHLPYGGGLLANAASAGLTGVPIPFAVEYAPKVWDWVRRYGRANFDSRVMGAVTNAGQETATEASELISKLAGRYRTEGLALGEELASLGMTDAATVRALVENQASATNQRVRDIVATMQKNLADFKAEADRLGVPLKRWGDPTFDNLAYFPRQLSAGAGEPGRDALAVLRPADSHLGSARKDWLQGIEGGTNTINRLALDPLTYQGTPLQRAQHVAATYLPDPVALANRQLADGKITPGQLNRTISVITRHNRAQARRLVDFADSLSPAVRQSIGTANEVSAFSHHPVADYLSYMERAARLQGVAEAGQNLLARSHLDPAAVANLAAGSRVRSVEKALRDAGMVASPAHALPAGAMGPPAPGAYARTLEKINERRLAAGQAPLANLDGVFVDEGVAKELLRYNHSFQAPESVYPAVRTMDYATNLFKGWVTAPFPAFHLRNLLSGAWVNMVEGGPSGVGRMRDAYRLLHGETLPWANQLDVFRGLNLTPEEATRRLAQQMAGYGISGHLPHAAQDIVGPAGELLRMPTTLDDVLARVPGHESKGLNSIADAYAGRGRWADTTWNPFKALQIQGAGSHRDVHRAVAAGREVGEVVEGVNRGGLFLDLVRQGWTPEEAARRTLKAHFDYTKNATTNFEKTVMRRALPFYTFTRQNIPYTLEQIATNPGGPAGTLARLAYAGRQDSGEFLPRYMGEGLAVPLGGEDEQGFRRYLTSLDLPPEQAFSLFKGTVGNPVQGLLMGGLAQLNPIPKALIEYATDRQFYSGRELGDLYSVFGDWLGLSGSEGQIIDQAVFNSPAARLMTDLRTVFDPRKYHWTESGLPVPSLAIPAKLLSGVKMTDVDVPKYRDIAEREYIEARLRGAPEVGMFEQMTVRPGMEWQLNDEQVELVRLQRLREKRARERRAENRPIRVQ